MYKKAITIRAIRKLMESGTRYTRACCQVVKTHQTIENWRNKKPMLDRYFLKLLDKREDRITDAVEDKLSDRLIKGEATPTEYIFYLCNRRPNKWHRQDGIVLDQSRHTHLTHIYLPKQETENSPDGLEAATSSRVIS